MTKYMLIMRGTDEAYAAYKQIPFEQLITTWAPTTSP